MIACLQALPGPQPIASIALPQSATAPITIYKNCWSNCMPWRSQKTFGGACGARTLLVPALMARFASSHLSGQVTVAFLQQDKQKPNYWMKLSKVDGKLFLRGLGSERGPPIGRCACHLTNNNSMAFYGGDLFSITSVTFCSTSQAASKASTGREPWFHFQNCQNSPTHQSRPGSPTVTWMRKLPQPCAEDAIAAAVGWKFKI